MATKTTTHLNFRGDAREALNFYQSVFGGHTVLVTYADAHDHADPAQADDILWGQVTSDHGFAIMAYDVQSSRPWNPGENAVYVSVRVDEADVLKAYWDKLIVGGTILTPFGPSGFSPLYGMVRDAFGITWVIDQHVAYAG